MRERLARLRKNLAYVFLGVALLWGASNALGPIWYLTKTTPLWSALGWLPWLTNREWVVVFMAVNGIVFVFSLHNALRAQAETTLAQIAVVHYLTAAQIGLLVIAMATIVGPSAGGRTVLVVAATTKWPWLIALGLALAANTLALIDSIERRLAKQVGPVHFWAIWLWQNIGCICFFAFLFVMILIGSFAYLNSPALVWLWLVAVVLIILSMLDVLLRADL